MAKAFVFSMICLLVINVSIVLNLFERCDQWCLVLAMYFYHIVVSDFHTVI